MSKTFSGGRLQYERGCKEDEQLEQLLTDIDQAIQRTPKNDKTMNLSDWAYRIEELRLYVLYREL